MACGHGIEPDKFCLDCETGEFKDVILRIVERSTKSYPEQQGCAALRCALGDAAHLCDMLAESTAKAHKGRHGTGAVTKQGRELQAAMKRCADAIWAMRDKIVVPR